MGKLLILFIIIPAIELGLLMKISGMIGLLPTVGISVLTGVLGAGLARQQGMAVLRQMQQEVASGELPANSIIDGVIILVAAVLLMTPGFLTDLFGFFCLIPGGRAVVKRSARSRVEHAVRRGSMNIYVGTK